MKKWNFFKINFYIHHNFEIKQNYLIRKIHIPFIQFSQFFIEATLTKQKYKYEVERSQLSHYDNDLGASSSRVYF